MNNNWKYDELVEHHKKHHEALEFLRQSVEELKKDIEKYEAGEPSVPWAAVRASLYNFYEDLCNTI